MKRMKDKGEEGGRRKGRRRGRDGGGRGSHLMIERMTGMYEVKWSQRKRSGRMTGSLAPTGGTSGVS